MSEALSDSIAGLRDHWVMADRPGRREHTTALRTTHPLPELAALAALLPAPVGVADTAGLSTPSAIALVVMCVAATIAALVVTARRSAEIRDMEDASRLSRRTDPLTGLPGAGELDAALGRAFSEACASHGLCALFLVELDGLVQLNAHGPEAGDRALLAAAHRLEEGAHTDDQMLRTGGQRFLVICTHAQGAPGCERMAQQIIRAIETPFQIDGRTFRLGARVGITLTAGEAQASRDLLLDAEGALRHARDSGAGSYALFDRTAPSALMPAALDHRLEAALEEGEFQLLYQPIVSLWTRRMVGVEALLRWVDPQRGVLGPAHFMAALESSEHLASVGAWILDEVCRQSRAWCALFPSRPALEVQVNLTREQLLHPDLRELVAASLARREADPSHLCLEVTEPGERGKAELVAESLHEVAEIGVTLALDDFGASSSSLLLLRAAPFRVLKLERDLVAGAAEPGVDRTVLEHFLSMAKSLSLVTVAIGVEREEQVTALRALGCDLAQGYYFSHPQPPHVIATLMASDGNRQEWQPPPPPPGAALVEEASIPDTARFRVPVGGAEWSRTSPRAGPPDVPV